MSTDPDEDPTHVALAYLTASLQPADDLHEQLFFESAATHDAAARFAIGLANVASLLCHELADSTDREPETVLQQLALVLRREPNRD